MKRYFLTLTTFVVFIAVTMMWCQPAGAECDGYRAAQIHGEIVYEKGVHPNGKASLDVGFLLDVCLAGDYEVEVYAAGPNTQTVVLWDTTVEAGIPGHYPIELSILYDVPEETYWLSVLVSTTDVVLHPPHGPIAGWYTGAIFWPEGVADEN